LFFLPLQLLIVKPALAGSFGNSSEVKVQSTTGFGARRSLTAPGRTDLMAANSTSFTVRCARLTGRAVKHPGEYQ
jgi:hypothetical protein